MSLLKMRWTYIYIQVHIYMMEKSPRHIARRQRKMQNSMCKHILFFFVVKKMLLYRIENNLEEFHQTAEGGSLQRGKTGNFLHSVLYKYVQFVVLTSIYCFGKKTKEKNKLPLENPHLNLQKGKKTKRKSNILRPLSQFAKSLGLVNHLALERQALLSDSAFLTGSSWCRDHLS